MLIPNPHNGYVPKVGERVRIIGACHPRCLGKVAEVTAVYEHDGEQWYECKLYYALTGEVCYSGGLLGGVEPAPGCPIDVY